MNKEIKKVSQIIRERRAIFPSSYINKKINKSIIVELLENANHAPTHRFTEPWRFKVFEGEGLIKLGDVLGELYKGNVAADKFSEMKYLKTKNKPTLCSHVIAICMQRDAKERVPEWEEIAAVAMAVQNMWLTASSYGIGSYWSSPSYMKAEKCRAFLNLKEGESCLGFFYLGYHELSKVAAKRKPIEDKVDWYNLETTG